MGKERFLPIGKIVGVHGLKGELKVFPYTENPQSFVSIDSITIRAEDGHEQIHTVNRARLHKKVILLTLDGIESINRAKEFIGSEILIEKEDLPALEDGSYYWHEIIGLSVFSKDDEFIGKVASVIPTGSNDVYVVEDSDNPSAREILIPAIKAVVLEIDLEKKKMCVDVPEGL